MKRMIIILGILLSLILLFGCADIDKEKGEASGSPKLVLSDFLPMQENVRYIYEGEGNEYASYDILIDFLSENKVQRRMNNGGTVSVEVIRLDHDQLIRSLYQEEMYYRENILEKMVWKKFF